MLNIGHSTIYGITGENSSLRGPRGATGQTGADQTIGGPTGPTGVNSNYVQEILVDNLTGEVTLVFSDDTINYNAGIIKGTTGVYAGITALSVGNNIPVLKGVCGGVTLEFYNFSPDGLVGITVDTDGSLKFFVNPNSIAGSIDSNIEPNKIVYAVQKNQITSTLLDVIQKTETAKQYGNTAYGYVNFGLTGGRSVVGDVQETLLTVGPIERGNKVITVDEFYTSGSSGITLDLSYSSVYKIVTPIGIKAFTTDNAPISDGQIYSVTLIVEGDDVWNFPENVIFDDTSKPIFYSGTNILHLWKSNLNLDSNWKAHFSARGFGVNTITNPGVVGSCCYLDADGTKNCKEYVTEDYCIQVAGTFSGLVPCNLNPCIVTDQKIYDGVCCSQGRCISNLDPDLCSTVGGYFISGITCGEYGVFPDDNTDNYGGLCYNKCKPATVCCKDGNCLGNLTKVHCEEILGGKIVEGEDCGSVNCCDLISARGACCIPQSDGSYSCEYADTPYECKTTKGGYYMGINSVCTNSICCNVPIDTCYECLETGTTCVCNPIDIYTGTCASNNLQEDCSGCYVKKCHKCDCQSGGCSEIEVCQSCPSGYETGPCLPNSCISPPTKTCYAPCGNSTNCRSQTATLSGGYDCRTCLELAQEGVVGSEFVNDACTDCPCTQFEKTCYGPCDSTTQQCPFTTVILGDDPNEIVNCNSNCSQLADAGYVPSTHVNDECECKSYAACFWCYPNITGPSFLFPGEGTQLDSPDDREWSKRTKERGFAPYRAVHVVPENIYQALESETNGITHSWSFQGKTYQFGPMQKITSDDSFPVNLNKSYHYIETGDCLARQQNLEEVQKYIAPMGFPFDDCGEFYCTYLGSYVFDGPNYQVNKSKCLDRFGYGAPEDESIKQTCKLCDNVGVNLIFQHPLFPGQSWTVNKIEKYQELIASGINAPFPPIWGRLSMWSIGQTCTKGAVKEATNNLALLDSAAALDMGRSFAGNGGTVQKGYLWWEKYVLTPDDGVPYDINSNTAQLKYSKIMNYPLFLQISRFGNKCYYANDGDPLGEGCICGQTDSLGKCVPGTIDHIAFDPYRMGGNSVYGAARGNYYIIKNGPSDTPSCDTTSFDKTEGWAHYNVPLGYEPIITGSDPVGIFNWSDNREIWFKRPQGSSSTSTPMHLRCPDDTSYSGPDKIVDIDGTPRGILGRNLRYNLAEFNTGTVFYNQTNKLPTMMTSGWSTAQNNPPLFKWTLWTPDGDTPCTNPNLPGADPACAPCCENDPENGICCSPCVYVSQCGGTRPICLSPDSPPCGSWCSCDTSCTGTICPIWCCDTVTHGGCGTNTSNCPGPSCGNTETGGQLNMRTGAPLGEKYAPIFNSNGEDITSFESIIDQTNSKGIESKTVKIAPGICVNMLCPECDSYESC